MSKRVKLYRRNTYSLPSTSKAKTFGLSFSLTTGEKTRKSSYTISFGGVQPQNSEIEITKIR